MMAEPLGIKIRGFCFLIYLITFVRMDEIVISYYMVCKDDILYDLTYTIVIQDYIKFKQLPSIDRLLEWRFKLMNYLESGKYPRNILD